MSYMQFQQQCDDCGKSWNAAFGIVGTTYIAQPPKKCPHCGSEKFWRDKMSHDFFCKCGHDIYSHTPKCQFCDCRRYDQKIAAHVHTWECLDASGRCMITGEV